MTTVTASTTISVDDKGIVNAPREVFSVLQTTSSSYISLLQTASSSNSTSSKGGLAEFEDSENLPFLPDVAVDDGHVNDVANGPEEAELLEEVLESTPKAVVDEVKGLKDDIRELTSDFSNLFKQITAALTGKPAPAPSPSPRPGPGPKPKPKPKPTPAPKPSPRPSSSKPNTVTTGKCAGYKVDSPFCDAPNPGPIYPSPESGMKDWESYFLDGHNKLRCLHGMPPMNWNKALAQKAQEWASDMGERYQRGQNPHSSHSFRKNVAGHWMVGENIAWQSRWSGYQAAELKATYSWYSEIKDTDEGRVRQGNTIPRSPMIGHYTQLVWKGSRDLGCGENKKGKGEGFYVCMYGAAGNMQGQVTSNVGKIKVDPGKCQDPRAWAASGGTKHTR